MSADNQKEMKKNEKIHSFMRHRTCVDILSSVSDQNLTIKNANLSQELNPDKIPCVLKLKQVYINVFNEIMMMV